MGRKKGSKQAGSAWDFRCVFDKAALGMALVDLQGRIQESNSALQALFGYVADEMKTRTVQDLSHPGDYEVNTAYLQQLLAGQGDSYQMEKRYFRKNGQLFWGHLTVSLVRNTKGAPQYVVATVADITERKRIQTALEKLKEKLAQQVQDRTREVEENEALYRSLFEHAAIGMARVYPDEKAGGTISHTNKALQNFLGYSDAEMETLTVKDLSQSEDFETDRKLLLEMVAGQRDFYQLEKRYFRKDGRMVWGLITVSLVRDSQGQPLFTVATQQDITIRKQAEEGLMRYSAELESKVLQRTQELEHNIFQLQAEMRERRKAQKQLQQSEERFRQMEADIRQSKIGYPDP